MTLLLTKWVVIMFVPCSILVDAPTCYTIRWDMGHEFDQHKDCVNWLDLNWQDPAASSRITRQSFECQPIPKDGRQ